MLIAGHEVVTNKKGEIKNGHIEVEKGFLRQGTNVKELIDDVGNSYPYTKLSFGIFDKSANEVFEFLAENTDVE